MNRIKIISQWIDGTVHDFDVDQSTAISLKKSLVSLTDIDQRRGDFTQSFGLPRTANNDLFFGQWGDPSTIGENWTPRESPPAFILEDDNIIIEGVLRLESTNPNMDRYYISITGTTGTIKTMLGEAEMSELDMSAWLYTPSQIYSTWARSLFSGDMVFPIHDFGFGWGLYKKSGTANVLQDFKNSATPIILDQTIPAFRLTKLLDMIFSEKGITVEGSFFSETSVDEIYVQADTALKSFATGVSLFTANHASKITLDTTTRKLAYACSPIHSDFDNANNQYVAPVAGTYYFDFNFTPTPGTPTTQTCYYGWYVNGVISGSNINFTWNAAVSVTGKALTLAAGDTVDIRVTATTGYTAVGYVFPSGSYLFKLTSVVTTGTSVDPSAYWAAHKQIDFFRSIVQIFNLVPWFTPEKKLRLDTWQYYMDTYGSKKDWSDKVDLPSINMKPINGELRDPVNLSLQEADNVLNNYYQELVGRPYGSYNEEQNIPGTLEPQPAIKEFSPACLQDIISSNAGTNYPQVIIGKYYTDEDSIAYKSPGLQLMYYCGVRTIPTSIYTADSAGGGTTARTVYPYFSNFLLSSGGSWTITAATLDLNFTWWTPPAGATGLPITAPSEQGLFNRYFREMIRERYDVAAKIVEMNVLLNAVDIANFSFADTIVIKVNGTPVGLRIVDIIDYSPNTTRLTKVKAYITFIK
jgi:hypothetical protein